MSDHGESTMLVGGWISRVHRLWIFRNIENVQYFSKTSWRRIPFAEGLFCSIMPRPARPPPECGGWMKVSRKSSRGSGDQNWKFLEHPIFCSIQQSRMHPSDQSSIGGKMSDEKSEKFTTHQISDWEIHQTQAKWKRKYENPENYA